MGVIKLRVNQSAILRTEASKYAVTALYYFYLRDIDRDFEMISVHLQRINNMIFDLNFLGKLMERK